MSKTLDYLKKIQGARENKIQSGSTPIALQENKYAETVNIARDPQEHRTPRKIPAFNKISIIALCVFIAINIGINAIAIFSLKNTSHENKSTAIRITEIEHALNKAIKKIETQGVDIKKTDDALLSINNKLKDANQKVSRLGEDFSKMKGSIQFDIENLNKAKNAMQNKISVLAEKISESKNAKQQ